MSDTLRNLCKTLIGDLQEARETIEGWGVYATDYFQQKHGLAGDLKAIDDRIARARAELEAAPAPVVGDVAQAIPQLRYMEQLLADRGQASAALAVARAVALLEIYTTLAPAPVAVAGEEYHEDMGAVTWWRFPIVEPPWVGTPNDSDWPGYHTHFTPCPAVPALPLPEVTP